MLTERQWQLEPVLRFFFMICVSLFSGMVMMGLAGQYLKGLSQDDLNLIHFIVGTGTFQGTGLVLLALLIREHQSSWSAAFGLRNPPLLYVINLSILSSLVILGGALFLGWISTEILNAFGMTPKPQPAVEVLQSASSLARKAFYGIVAILVAPIAEEMIFRGVLYPTIKEHGYPKMALWGTSIFFAATHLSLVALLPLTFVALMFTWLYEKTNNLLAPISAHALFNGANFVLLMTDKSIGS